jgi:UMP-CMP kinase
MDNINGWNEVFGNSAKILCVLVLRADEKVCVERILERGKTSGRTDDNREVLVKRFNTFYSESEPILEVLKKDSKVIEIQSGSKENVFENICKNIDSLIY